MRLMLYVLSSRYVRLLGVAVLTLALLVWALQGVSFTLVWGAVQQSHLEWLGLGLISFLGSCSVRARRWGTLLGARCATGHFGIRHAAVFIGFAGNCMLPAHMGEIARAGVLNRFGGVPFGAALVSIFTERLLDAIVVFLFLMLPLLLGIITQEGRVGLGVLPLSGIGVMLVCVGGIFFVAACWPTSIIRGVNKVSEMIGLGRFTSHIVAHVQSLLNGLAAIRSPKLAIMALVETFCIWGLIMVFYWAGMLAFDIRTPGVSGALFVGSVATLGIALPSAPGYFGPFEAAIRFALAAYAISTDLIIAYALTLHLFMYISLTTIGVVLVARLGLSWADLVPRTEAPIQPSSTDVT